MALPKTYDVQRIISILRKKCYLSYRDIAAAAGVSVRAIRVCEKSNILPADARVRIWNLYEICGLLLQDVKAGAIKKWLREPKDIFDGKSPLELISEFRSQEVKNVIYSLIDNSFS